MQPPVTRIWLAPTLVLIAVGLLGPLGCAEDKPSAVAVQRFALQTLLSDDFTAGLGKWTQTGDGNWVSAPAHDLSTYPPSSSGSPVLHADSCSTSCTLRPA